VGSGGLHLYRELTKGCIAAPAIATSACGMRLGAVNNAHGHYN
jgi:hypothetical protein